MRHALVLSVHHLLHGIVHADKLHAVRVLTGNHGVDDQWVTLGGKGGKAVVHRDLVAALAGAAGGAVAAADHRTAVGGGAAGQGMVKLEVDVVQKIAVGGVIGLPALGVVYIQSVAVVHGGEGEDGFCLRRGHRVEIVFARIEGGIDCVIVSARIGSRRNDRVRSACVHRLLFHGIFHGTALGVGAVGRPRVGHGAVRAAGIGHDPNVPLLGIGGAGRQGEGLPVLVILERAVLVKLFAENNNILTVVVDAGGCGLFDDARILEPVHHLHPLVAAVLVALPQGRVLIFAYVIMVIVSAERLAGGNLLLGTDNQGKGVQIGTGAVIQSPLINSIGIGADHLIEGAFLVTVQLRRLGTAGGGQGDIGDIDALVCAEILDPSVRPVRIVGGGIPIGDLALLVLDVVGAGKRRILKVAVLQHIGRLGVGKQHHAGHAGSDDPDDQYCG